MGLADGKQAMALITTCQACQTQFEVTEEQLSAFDGQVRCGECQQVFDARLQLETLDDDVASTDAVKPQSPPDQVRPAVSESSLDMFEDVAIRRARHAIAEAAARLAEIEEGASDVSSLLPPVHTPPASVPAPTVVTVAADEQVPEAEISPPILHAPVVSDASPEAAMPAFLRDRAITPMSTARHRALMVAVILLALLLLGQWLYAARHALAASYPQVRPWLTAGCQWLHCTIMLPKHLDQLQIDDADVQEHPAHEGVLVFSSVLSNHDNRSLAFPVIELTLTSTGDEAVLRRHLQPEDYLPATINASDGIAAGQTVPVKVLLTVEASALANHAVAGFRVTIAYP